MTELKINIALTTDCNLTLLDVTGFLSSNATGFIDESTSSIPVGSYKLSNGYFIDVLTYNQYNAAPIIVLNSTLRNIPSADVDPVYANNFEILNYNLAQDSMYSLHRLFIMSEAFYNANKTTNRFDNKNVYYTDGVDIYKVIDGIPSVTKLGNILLDVDSPSTNLHVVNTFVSTCYLNICYFNIMQELLKDGCASCNDNSVLLKQRDLLYMSLEVIQYLKDLGTTSEIQKIIQTLDLCGGFCKSIIRNNSDCGCNG